MRLSITFWNVGYKFDPEVVSDLVDEKNPYILVLAESPLEPSSARAALADIGSEPVFSCDLAVGKSKTSTFSNLDSSCVVPCYAQSSGRLSAFELRLPAFPKVVLGCVHLASKLNAEQETQYEEALRTSEEFAQLLMERSTPAGVICGDFNMNPFEIGMRSARYFHGVIDRGVALREARTIQGQRYPMLYNPMWSFLGDMSAGPPGTFYYSPAEHGTTHWHMVDQFLTTASVVKQGLIGEVKIITRTERFSLSDNQGRPGGIYGSDHFPVQLDLKSDG